MEAQNRLLVILGAGESGVGAAILAQAKGWRVLFRMARKLRILFKKNCKITALNSKPHGIPWSAFSLPTS